jgi:hypothetical protein
VTGPMRDDRDADEPQLERLRTGGATRATAVVVLIATTIGVLVWRPWGTTAQPGPGPVASAAAEIAQASPSGAALPVPSPSLSAFAPLIGTIGPYRSLVDNEWTIVALLTPGTTATEEPVMPHVPLPAWSADGPFLVLQQGMGPASARRLSQVGGVSGVCSSAAPARVRPAVHLPTGRVAYLGITYPGMDPKAAITATVLGRSGATLRRVSPLVVQLDGLSPAGRYTLPSSGPGGTILFATSEPGIIPTEAYRFDVSLPGVAGHRYLYACVDA